MAKNKIFLNYSKNESGLTVVELIIAMTLFLMLSIGVYQIFKLGFAALDRNAAATSKNAYSNTFNNIVTTDMAKSDGFIVSSATSSATKKADLCTSWNSANQSNFQDFTQKKPLLTIYEKHATVINYATASGNEVTYVTNTAPDFKVGQLVSISGLSANSGANFNLLNTSNVPIVKVQSTKPYSFTVANSSSLNGTSSPTTITASVTAINEGTYTLDSIQGIGNDMIVNYSDQQFVTSNANQVTSTIKFTPNTSAIPTGTLLTFISTSNGIAETHSYVGYELRKPFLNSTNQESSELWRITCQSLGQSLPDSFNPIKLRTGLPALDLVQISDWIQCPQIKNITGLTQSPFSDKCPQDVYLSSGNSSFLTRIGSGGTSTSTDLYLANSFNFSSSAQVGMSVNYSGIDAVNTRAYITAVDLTDPSGDARITIACVNGLNNSSQITKTCPAPPAIGQPVTIGVSVFVICSLTNGACSTNGTNALDVADVSLLNAGMYIDLDNGNFGVLDDTSGNLGSQNVVFAQLPSAYSLPQVLEFHRPSAIRFWIPKSSDPKGGPEQVVVAGRASA